MGIATRKSNRSACRGRRRPKRHGKVHKAPARYVGQPKQKASSSQPELVQHPSGVWQRYGDGNGQIYQPSPQELERRAIEQEKRGEKKLADSNNRE